MTSAQSRYRVFLRSEFWCSIRRQCFERDGHRCQRCNSPNRLQAHHLRYPRDWYQTTLAMLVTLCRKCHRKAHHITKPERVEIVDIFTLSKARSLGQITKREFRNIRRTFEATILKNNPSEYQLQRAFRKAGCQSRKVKRIPK